MNPTVTVFDFPPKTPKSTGMMHVTRDFMNSHEILNKGYNWVVVGSSNWIEIHNMLPNPYKILQIQKNLRTWPFQSPWPKPLNWKTLLCWDLGANKLKLNNSSFFLQFFSSYQVCQYFLTWLHLAPSRWFQKTHNRNENWVVVPRKEKKQFSSVPWSSPINL